MSYVAVVPLLDDGEFILTSEITQTKPLNSEWGSCDIKININLFDRDGKSLATKFGPRSSEYANANFIERILSSPNCFQITIKNYGVPYGCDVKNYYFFETLFLTQHKDSNMSDSDIGPVRPFDHSLTREMLYTIKYFQLHTGNWGCDGWYFPHVLGHALHKFRPELFKSHSPEKVEFDKKAKLDKLRIESQEKEIQSKFEENQKIKLELEKKEIRLKEEETNLLEEKKKLFAVKQKLDLMKQELQLERDAFEKEKRVYDIKNIDLDDYFEIPVATVVATKVTPTVGETILEYADL